VKTPRGVSSLPPSPVVMQSGGFGGVSGFGVSSHGASVGRAPRSVGSGSGSGSGYVAHSTVSATPPRPPSSRSVHSYS
jgi:hypothetical protein